MKKKFFKTVFSLGLALALVLSLAFPSSSPVLASESSPAATEELQEPLATASSELKPVYRLYLDTNGEHLYTLDTNEVRILTTQNGWTNEGIAWYAPSSGQPVYRLYNSGLQNHLYTMDTNEIRVLTTQDSWVMDNKGNPVFYSGGTVPIYRVYNYDLRGLHHLTKDRNEYDKLPAHGWAQEGVSFYGSTAGTDAYPSNITNTASQYTIEADVKLTGSGSGYHAKILACTASSAVSFGLQFDNHAVAPYTGKTSFLIENVLHNGAGGQSYSRTGVGQLNTTYHLMLTVQQNGQCDVYVDGIRMASVNNPGLANQTVYLRVEGSGRINGDSVNATFTNIELKGSGTYNPTKVWGTHDFGTNASIHSNDQYAASKRVTISGRVSGLSANQDWDNAYNSVSGITQFVE